MTSEPLTRTTVARRIGVPYMTLRRWIAAGCFPPPDAPPPPGCKLRRWRPGTVAPFLIDGPGLNQSQVARVLGVAKATIPLWIARGEFPPPDVRIGPHWMRWRRATVADWRAKAGF